MITFQSFFDAHRFKETAVGSFSCLIVSCDGTVRRFQYHHKGKYVGCIYRVGLNA